MVKIQRLRQTVVVYIQGHFFIAMLDSCDASDGHPIDILNCQKKIPVL